MKRPYIEVAQNAEEDVLFRPGNKQHKKTDKSSDFEAGLVIADEIQTCTLQVDHQFLGSTLTTSNGDIAYHFHLKDQTQQFSEGEVIGFVGGEKCQNVEKLTLQNCKRVKLKGVVTRSQYLEAQKPEDKDEGKTETICMLGSVPVKVKGSIHANDSLYSSPDLPGVAVSGRNFKSVADLSYAFIGVAFSARLTNDQSSVGFVQAIVSINESYGQRLANEKLEQIDELYNEQINQAQGTSRRWRKRCIVIAGTLLTFFALLGILFWQIYYPGTAFRYWKCKQGRMKPDGSSTFTFIPLKNRHRKPKVNGVEFSFIKMVEKMNFDNMEPLNLNGTHIRYYINIDRCAYGGLRATADKTLGLKAVAGPNVFAIDAHCNRVYYHDGDPPAHWNVYNSARWDCFKNVFCNPMPASRWDEAFQIRLSNKCK